MLKFRGRLISDGATIRSCFWKTRFVMRAGPTSPGVERIDDLDAASLEITDIPGRHGGSADKGDGG
jgi:hypothetical protein